MPLIQTNVDRLTELKHDESALRKLQDAAAYEYMDWVKGRANLPGGEIEHLKQMMLRAIRLESRAREIKQLEANDE
jgi:hypothetical protein